MGLRSIKFSWIFVLLFLTAPLYVWRFSVGVPTNFLMLFLFLVIFLGFIYILIAGEIEKFLKQITLLPKPVLVGVCLIIISSLLSLFVFEFNLEKFGQWLVLYAQPIAIFFLLYYFKQEDKKFEWKFNLAIYLFLFFAGLLAILQYTTLWGLPMGWWGNSEEPKRAIAFFAHPNAFALFITPLLAWLIPDVTRRIVVLWDILMSSKSWMQQAGEIIRQRVVVLAWLVGLVGLFLSLSRGGWLGLLLAAGVYALLSANKKVLATFFVGALLLVGIVFAVPNLRWRVLLPFHGEKSSLARFSLWDTGSKMIKDSPILGKGISGFDSNWYAYNTDPGLNHYNFPHNILLNFWVDLGLLGVIGFVVLFGWVLWNGFVNRKNHLAMALLLFMVALVVHGLIDIPYLKNDLALVFWLILAIGIV